jgi:hypothetical protein
MLLLVGGEGKQQARAAAAQAGKGCGGACDMLLLVGGEGKQQARAAAAQAGKAGGGASSR